MLIDQVDLQAGHQRADLGRGRRPRRVRAPSSAKLAGADAVGVVSSRREGRAVQASSAPPTTSTATSSAGMMRRGGETPEEEKARFKESRRFCKHVAELLGGQPDIVFEHVGQATFPTSVLAVKPFGKVVICGATSGYQLDFDVRYLWMRQKQIIGSHFANAWECNKANELIEQGKIRPVLWRTLRLRRRRRGAPAHAREQAPRQDRDPRRAPRPRARARPPRARARSERRWVPDGRRRATSPGTRRCSAATSSRRRCSEIAPIALRYGATDWSRLPLRATTATSSMQIATFESKRDCTSATGTGPSSRRCRADYSGWYQVPVLYVPDAARSPHEPASAARERRRGALSPARAGPS